MTCGQLFKTLLWFSPLGACIWETIHYFRLGNPQLEVLWFYIDLGGGVTLVGSYFSYLMFRYSDEISQEDREDSCEDGKGSS